MRIFDASDSTGAKPADPKAIDHFEDPISSLSASVRPLLLAFFLRAAVFDAFFFLQKDLWCAACDNGEVAVFTGGQNELASILTRCTLPIRSARFDPKGKWVVVASECVWRAQEMSWEDADWGICNFTASLWARSSTRPTTRTFYSSPGTRRVFATRHGPRMETSLCVKVASSREMRC